MIALKTNRPEYFSEICEVIRLFVDVRKILRIQELTKSEGYEVSHRCADKAGTINSTVELFFCGECVVRYTYSYAAPKTDIEYKRAAKRAVKISAYRALLSYFKTPVPWGSLTGIRPAKLLRDSEALLGEKGAKALFIDEFDVSLNKYQLAKAVVKAQVGLESEENAIDMYIGIPFCATRCAYCSFASYSTKVFENAQQQYVDALFCELGKAKEMLEGRNVRALYIGGGTPTAIDVNLLEGILKEACALAGGAKEITVEAGRPDAIDQEKLAVIKHYGANRISVNAQTLSDETLKRIGRRHTVAQFYKAFECARDAGFDVINVDLIAGLPGETCEGFCSTLLRIIGLAPENITVHTLAIKRSSAFAAANLNSLPSDLHTALTLEKAHDMLGCAGYIPYYMYRQKYMKGSLENTGYSKRTKECLYNIDNMQELCSVIAFGAGAISKRLFDKGRIERAANVKGLKEYIERCEQMADNKRKLFAQPCG